MKRAQAMRPQRQNIHVDEAMVRRLLAAQVPDLADLPLSPVEAGTDNYIFRLGPDYAVRLPMWRIAGALILNEQKFLPMLTADLPVPVPVPRFAGKPGEGFPWGWSVVPWIEGASADLMTPDPAAAAQWAAFLRGLHRPAPKDAPRGNIRGDPLSSRQPHVEARLHRLARATEHIPEAIGRAWRTALAAASCTEARLLHGDLHPQNVLVQEGAIAGVIDWGLITQGDVAADLASVWMLFEAAPARETALETYGASAADRARARGWAIIFGAVLLETGIASANARHADMGRKTLARVAEDAGPG